MCENYQTTLCDSHRGCNKYQQQKEALDRANWTRMQETIESVETTTRQLHLNVPDFVDFSTIASSNYMSNGPRHDSTSHPAKFPPVDPSEIEVDFR